MVHGSTPFSEDSESTPPKPPSSAGNRSSYGYWTGSKSSLSTPNLGGSLYQVSYDLHNSGSIHGRDAFGSSPSTSSSFPLTTDDAHGGNTQTFAQAQDSSVGSIASVDSASSASFQKQRKRSESTGGFKSTAGNISRIVRKSSSNFLKKLVKNFDDKDAPPIPTTQYSMSSVSLVSHLGDYASHSLAPEMPMLRSLSTQNVRRIGPLDTPPPLSPLMGHEMAYQFAAPMSPQDTGHHHVIDAEVHPSSWPNSSTSALSGSQYMTTTLSPQEVADSLAKLVAEAALVAEDRNTEVDDEEEEEDEDGDEDEDEDEDVPAAITNRLSRLYETGSIHMNQSQTSLYYSTKSTLSDSEASEMMASMSPASSPNAARVTSEDINSNSNSNNSSSISTGNTSNKGGSSSKRGSFVQDALGYSLGLSRGNSIRFSQYNLGTMQGISGAPVQPLTVSTSTPTSPGTVRGTSSTATPANNREFGEARKLVARRPVTMFIPLTSSATDYSESDVDTLSVAEDFTYDAAPTSVQLIEEQQVSSPPTSPYRERVQERVLQILTVDTASLPPTDTVNSSPILPPSFGRSLSLQSAAPPKRPMTVCVDTTQSLAPLYPLATPTLLTPDDPTTGEQRENASLLAQRTARRCFEEDESFLRREEISEYLGTPKPFHQQVLGAYMNHFDFHGKRIDLAFRLLCQKLILKGETQEVDRILEAFARRYVDCNDGRLSEGGVRSRPILLAVADHAKDVVHAVSYSILLLNTDLHVVQQSTKMSRSAFVKNTLEVVQAQRGGSSTPGMGSPVHTVDPTGLGIGMPRSLTSDSISEAGLNPPSTSSFPSMGRRRTPSVKSWKSGHSQQSSNFDLSGSSGNIAHSSSSNSNSNSRMGSDPSANGGYGNGKAWIQELESLFKEIYTAVKHSQIRLPSPTSAIQTPVSGPHSSRGGSRSNSTFSAISSPPTSPAMAPVGGFGSSLFSSNRMSRLIQPSALFTSNQTHLQQPMGGSDVDHPTDSGVGLFGGSVNRRKSMSTRANQLRTDAIQRLSAQAQVQAQANAQAMANAMAVAQAQAEADAEMRDRDRPSSARSVASANTLSSSMVAPPNRTRYSVFGNLDVSFGGGGGAGGGGGNGNGSTFVDRGPVSSRDVVYQQQQQQQQSQQGFSRRHSHFVNSEHGTNTSVSTETTPSASQNSLASLQSSTLSMSAGGPRDEPRSKPSLEDSSSMEHKTEGSVSSGPPPSQEVSTLLDEFTAEQKELRHQLHLQSRYRMEGILWRKHLLERSDKKAQHRAWRQLLVVLDMEQGALAMFRSDGTLPAMSKSALASPASNQPPSVGANRHHPSSGHKTNPTTPTSSTSIAHMALFDEIPLQHTITNILPPPGYSSTRRNVFAVQLFTGGVYLFQTSTPQECENWARSCNYWAARTSKEPLAGGVINMEYGWGRALETYLSRSPLSPSALLSPLVTVPQHELGLSPMSHSALTSPFVQSPGAMSSASVTSPNYMNHPGGPDTSGYFGPLSSSSSGHQAVGSPLQVRSSGRSTSMKSSSSRRGSISLSSFGAMTGGGAGSTSAHSLTSGSSSPPGDHVALFEWTAPQPAMALSPHTEEADQLWALKKYVLELESEMESHQEHRGPMLKLFPPKSVNHVKAFNNWERRSRHLLKEMVKNKIYEECLAMSISYQNEQDQLELKAWQTLQRQPRPPQPHLQEGPLSEARKEQYHHHHHYQHQHQYQHGQPGGLPSLSLSFPVTSVMSSSDLEADLEALVVHDEPDL